MAKSGGNTKKYLLKNTTVNIIISLLRQWLQKKKKEIAHVSSILTQHKVYQLMCKSATPSLPESLIFQKDGYTWVKFEGYKHLLCQLYLPKIYQSLKLHFSVFTTATIGTSFFTTVMVIFFDHSMISRTIGNLCFGKGNILLRSAVYHKTNIKI